MRRLASLLLLLTPGAALAQEGSMPQMEFTNPLTSTQVIWMAVILVVLYLLLARWGLPEMGKVLENRAKIIRDDLAAARAAKNAADAAVAQLNATMSNARQSAQAQIAAAAAEAKAKAAHDAALANAALEQKLAESEAQIEQARNAALAAIKPVAKEAAGTILRKLTGTAPAEDELSTRVDAALAARKAA